MSPVALPVPNGHNAAQNQPQAGPSKPHPPALHLTSKHFTTVKSHFMDLSETAEHHGSDGTRTPRPGNLTPSPPRSRRASRSSKNGSRRESVDRARSADMPENGGDNEQSVVSGKKTLDGKGRLYKEDEGEVARLMRTVDFAARKHTCQRRKDLDQTPYINHPIAVANFLSSTGITDVRVLQAAILHDTVEDTPTTIEEIALHFGPDVARIVQECTDNPNLTGQGAKNEQVRTAPHKSPEAQQVKLADKLHNLESIRRAPPVGWGQRRVQAYFIWAKQVTDICAPSHPPLAQRLQRLYETAYTEIDGKYFPCHPEVAGPLLEEEKLRIDGRLRHLKKGEKPCPYPIFF